MGNKSPQTKEKKKKKKEKVKNTAPIASLVQPAKKPEE